jgi:nitrogen fixation protein FixH
MPRFALALLAAVLFIGCTRPATITSQQTVNGLSIALERPAQPVVLHDYELTVTLTDAQGRPVDGASVYLDLTMPAHPMGINQPIAEPLGQGRYRVRAVSSMGGDWLVTIVASIAGTEHRAVFELPVALP